MTREVEPKPTRAVVAAVQLPDVSDLEFEASVIELRQLAKTLGFEVVRTFTQKRRRFDAGAYLGSGKREELRRFVRDEPELDDVAGALPAGEDDEEHESEDEAGDGHEAGDGGRAAREAPRGGKVAKRAAAEAKEAAEAPADPATRRADVLLVDHEISPSQGR